MIEKGLEVKMPELNYKNFLDFQNFAIYANYLHLGITPLSDHSVIVGLDRKFWKLSKIMKFFW